MSFQYHRIKTTSPREVYDLAEMSDLQAISLNVTKEPLYEYRDMWAEEGGGVADGSFQYSYGNGATGYIGLPIDEDWELIAFGIQTDIGGSAGEQLVVGLVDIGASPSASAPTIHSSIMNGAGDGVDDNAWQYEDLSNSPVTVPGNTFLGFRTINEEGAYSDVRAYARFRRKIGEYVSDVTMGTGSNTNNLGTPSNGEIVSDNFQDGNGNTQFNLQIRNTTGNTLGWVAEVQDVPYATIPSLVAGNYTHTVNNNGDGTYTHVFQSTVDLGAYANITIQGGMPTPAGNGTGLVFYIS